MARVILRDGYVADLRKAENTPTDKELIRNLLLSASEESLYFRFFQVIREFDDTTIAKMVGDGGASALTLMCTDGHRALGIGSYQRVGDYSAEVTFLVDDNAQHRGLGSLLLENLAERAYLNGIRQFEANVHTDNERMMHVFRASGFSMTSNQESGVIHLVWTLRHNERSRALQETRERLATAASLHSFFHPRSVAVVGASRTPDRLGHVIFRHILNSDYRGTVYPVNPTAASVAAVKAYPTLADVPEPVDLAVLVVPASQILSVVDDCIAAGVKAVMVVSSGFSDTDPPGRELERELLQRLRTAGCRLIGPNSLGLIQLDPELQLNASFSPQVPEHGRVAIASHSGALGITILDYATRIGLGISSFVSLGNRADVSGNDVLQYWESDPETDMILLYLESFGNPRKFTRITRRITRNKPILAVKSARTPVSVDVAKSRTVAVAAEDATVEAMFRQTGIIRVDTLQELFDVAVLLRAGECHAGRRVAIVTNTAGGAVMTVDRLLREGLEFVSPVMNLGFEALAESYRVVLPQVLRDPAVDAVVVLFTPVGPSYEEAVRVAISAALCEVANDPPQPGVRHPYEKPVVANFLTTGDYRVRYLEVDSDRQIPIYPFPEQAVRALAKVSAYHEYRDRDPGHIPDLADIDTQAARDTIRSAFDTMTTSTSLNEKQVRSVVQSLGISLEFENEKVQPPQAQIVVRVDSDPLFGPLIRLDLGGHTSGESTVQDQVGQPLVPAMRLVPLTDADAEGIWREARGRYEGSFDKNCRDTVIDMILRLSQWVEDVPEVTRARFDIVVKDGQLVCAAASVSATWVNAPDII
ncbi:bifunctional acetate--CoA ligase family protein/GNAT family N-acetyltransferase [Alicyclobacillus dauci]|uniref:GNAT family N-acetyltransferase n=1 Tax=Alicyclobacillus dauci TaxID=1475485 RepID=A0ABY6YZC4_9BACL|nr:GNAT family N-acetyltransferase [Alicyclobacillus dauci]WAH35941.1 GNAT family N-acetyltransferase [Alicyclobacillus dauci]